MRDRTGRMRRHERYWSHYCGTATPKAARKETSEQLSAQRIIPCDSATPHDRRHTPVGSSCSVSWGPWTGQGSSTSIPQQRSPFVSYANKADENYSCFPSDRALMAESSAGRNTILRAFKKLEDESLITPNPQFQDSRARRATRYCLNHPLAPHLALTHRPDTGLPCPDTTPAPSQPWTGGVSSRDTTGVSNRDPLNPTPEAPTEPRSEALTVIKRLRWKIGLRDARNLAPTLVDALTADWTTDSHIAHLSRNPDGIRYPARVLARRLSELPKPPMPPDSALAWCGECEDPQSRTITVTLADGTDAAAFCPRCKSAGSLQKVSPCIPSKGRR